jgi:hypothetical protein
VKIEPGDYLLNVDERRADKLIIDVSDENKTCRYIYLDDIHETYRLSSMAFLRDCIERGHVILVKAS